MSLSSGQESGQELRQESAPLMKRSTIVNFQSLRQLCTFKNSSLNVEVFSLENAVLMSCGGGSTSNRSAVLRSRILLSVTFILGD